MKLSFWKMHGAQNDFVLFDDRDGTFPSKNSDFIRHIAARHSGVGAEGVILIQPSVDADFFMRFFNPDGREAEMCGNGARCTAQLACELGITGKDLLIETVAGRIRAQVLEQSVCLWMTEPFGWELDGSLEVDRRHLTYGFVNTGVPHVVMRTGNLQDVDVKEVGQAVRRHRAFAPDGTNVNFMQIFPEDDVWVRTYERGVEAETLACGTGVTACALIAARNGWVKFPVLVHTQSSTLLTVNGELAEGGVDNVTLTGPSEHVFEGTIEYKG